MIKAKVGKTLVLGLSDMNIEKLKEGMPIVIQGDKIVNELGFDNLEKFRDGAILLFHGETEEDMVNEMLDRFQVKG